MAINEPGQIVGYSVYSYVWDKNGVMLLPPLPGAPYCAAYSINNRGQVVGESVGANSVRRAVIWENGRIRDLNFLPPDWSTSATAINNAGEIAVYGEHGSTADFHTYVLRNGTLTELPPLPDGFQPGVQGINDPGQVVGFCHTSDSPMTAVIWERN
jgi:probable HAF family extracellular repeat protein